MFVKIGQVRPGQVSLLQVSSGCQVISG